MKLTVPTMLTLLRILLIPVLVLVFYLPWKWTNFAAAFVFLLASVTDWLDGWIARAYNQSSAFGAFLDQVLNDLVGGVRVDLQIQRESAHGGKGFTGLHFPRQDRFDGREANLVEDRLARDQLELERDHVPSGVTCIL